MDAWELAEAAEEVSRIVTPETARAILSAVPSDATQPAVRRALRTHAPTDAQSLLSTMVREAGQDRTWAALAAAVVTLVSVEQQREQVELVWTGPATVPVPSHRTTAAVAHEMIASAQEHITLATFSAGKVDDFIAALDERRRGGVGIRLLLETPRSDGSGPDCPKVFEPLLPYVNALEWPRERRRHPDWTSMHVKVIIRDSDAVLVTSANMSEAAMRHNMEVGVKISGGSIALRLRQHFDHLEALGVLRPL